MVQNGVVDLAFKDNSGKGLFGGLQLIVDQQTRSQHKAALQLFVKERV